MSSTGTPRLRARAPTDPADAVRRARRVLLVSAAVTLLLYVAPLGHLLARPLLYISTLVHELGHGLTALLVGGEFYRLEMWSDGSGVAWSAARGDLQHALIAAGGLVGPAVAAAAGFALARRRRSARWALGAIGLLLVWAMIFKIRTGFGLLVAGALAGACVAVALRATSDWAQLLLGFLSVQLALSVFSRGDYLFADTAQTGAGTGMSDSASIAELIGGPTWFWGGVCAAISLAALVFGAWVMLRGVRRSSGLPAR
ncbi:MAG TPA: M50 family metallopeptidase [Kofleriaceae bacterium]|nr:M50 family metallopeptidase [Kofleriaceae bacterium]